MTPKKDKLNMEETKLAYWEEIYKTTHSEATKQRAKEIIEFIKKKRNND